MNGSIDSRNMSKGPESVEDTDKKIFFGNQGFRILVKKAKSCNVLCSRNIKITI